VALLAAVLFVGFTTDAGASNKIDVIAAELAQHVENQMDGLSCTATPVVGASYELLVITVVCRAKVEAG
jgi:hypothetical protein